MVVAIETKELTEEQEGRRAPVDLICVIDISGSMEGEKLALVRKTLLSLLTMMGDQDRLCLIQFDNNAEVLVPLKRVGSHNVELMKRMVNSLEARGGTNIANGVDLAFQVIRDCEERNPITSIFLLTDGLDPGAASRVSACLAGRDLASVNFSIDCFGFGADHDEDLMVGISKLKDGSFYFIDQLDTIDECFAKALGGLMSVVAKDVDILVLNSSFKPFENIKIRRTFGSMWQREGVTSGSKIHLTQLLAGVEKGFVLELEIPPTLVKVSDTERTHCVLEVELTAQNNSNTVTVRKSATLKLHLINEDERLNDIEEDGEVMENYFRVKSAEAIEQAIKLSNSGQYEQGVAR